MKEKKNWRVPVKAPENLVTYDPDKLPYQKLHLCTYMRELLDEAEKTSQDSSLENQAVKPSASAARGGGSGGLAAGGDPLKGTGVSAGNS